jgi:hypothetical protein
VGSYSLFPSLTLRSCSGSPLGLLLLLPGVCRSNCGNVELNHSGVNSGCGATGIGVRAFEALVGNVDNRVLGRGVIVVARTGTRERAAVGVLEFRTWVVDARATLTLLLIRDMSPGRRRQRQQRRESRA